MILKPQCPFGLKDHQHVVCCKILIKYVFRIALTCVFYVALKRFT